MPRIRVDYSSGCVNGRLLSLSRRVDEEMRKWGWIWYLFVRYFDTNLKDLIECLKANPDRSSWNFTDKETHIVDSVIRLNGLMKPIQAD